MNAEHAATIRNLMILGIFAMAWALAVALRPRSSDSLLRSIFLFFLIDALFYTYAVVATVLQIVIVPTPYGGLVVVTGLFLAHAVLTWAALIRGVKATVEAREAKGNEADVS